MRIFEHIQPDYLVSWAESRLLSVNHPKEGVSLYLVYVFIVFPLNKHHRQPLTDSVPSQPLIFNTEVVSCVQVGFDELLSL